MNPVPPSVNWLALLVPLSAVLAGLLLLWLAWRGRRVGDHPVCRRCGFDLRGLPKEAAHCSECGAPVRGPDGIAVGDRRRNTPKVAAAAVLLLVALAWLALAGWSASGGLDAQRYKPAWWLMRETRSADVRTRDAALTELVRRYDAAQLPEARLDELVEQALALQADKAKPWNVAWGEVVEKRYAAGKVSNDRWEQFLGNMLEPTLEVRPVVRRGDRIPFWTGWTPSRGGRQNIAIQMAIPAADFDGTIQLGPPGLSSNTYLNGPSRGGRARGSSLTLKEDVLRRLDDGPHRLRMTVDVIIGHAISKGGPVAKEQVTLEAPVRFVTAGTETVKVLKDPSFHSGVQSALLVSEVTFDTLQFHEPRLFLTVSTTPPPVGVAYDVFVRAGDREWKIGRVARAAGGEPHGYGIEGDGKGFDAEKADVVFRPSVEAALATVEVHEIWDGEVVLKDVPVKRREK